MPIQLQELALLVQLDVLIAQVTPSVVTAILIFLRSVICVNKVKQLHQVLSFWILELSHLLYHQLGQLCLTLCLMLLIWFQLQKDQLC